MHDDFKSEPVRGLPEALPEGEHILWQGSPLAGALAREAWGIRWVAGYFAAIALIRFTVSSATVSTGMALNHAVPFIVVGALACAMIYFLAIVQSRATVYTLTNRRVAMRIGTALTMTLNLPYVKIGSASVDARKGGHGTLAFELMGQTKLSYLMTWPHVRPWFMAHPQPALRCIPDVGRVAAIFADAAEIRTNEIKISRVSTMTDPVAIAAE